MDEEPLNKKEILSNFQIFKSERQQEAVRTNKYLQGFAQGMEEKFFNVEVCDVFGGKFDKKYVEGRDDAIYSIMKLSNEDYDWVCERISQYRLDSVNVVAGPKP